jgi:hypothetical protein
MINSDIKEAPSAVIAFVIQSFSAQKFLYVGIVFDYNNKNESNINT